MVKKDLTEFSEAVQTETSTMLSETSSLLSSTSQTLKQSLQVGPHSTVTATDRHAAAHGLFPRAAPCGIDGGFVGMLCDSLGATLVDSTSCVFVHNVLEYQCKSNDECSS